MKTKFLTTVALLFLVLAGMSQKNVENPVSENEAVKVCVTPEMYSLAESWIEGYRKANPEKNIELMQADIAELAGKTAEENMLGFYNQTSGTSVPDEKFWQMAVGREIFVPVINSNNPFLEKLKLEGVSATELSALFSNAGNRSWGTLLSSDYKEAVNVYLLKAAFVQESVAEFLNVNPAEIKATAFENAEDLLKAVRSDKYAIAFCKLNDVVDKAQNSFVEQIGLLPLDRNENGKIDYSESIFEQPAQFERSVWIGKYPRTLVRNIYAVASDFPANESSLDFLNWIVTSGQSAVIESGYTSLALSEKQSNLDKLASPVLERAESVDVSSQTSAYIYAGLILFIVVLAIGIAIRRRNRRIKMPLGTAGKLARVMNENGFACPGGLYFDKSHTWVFMEEEGRLKLGVDDFISRITGDYTRVILKNPGEKVRRDEPIVTLVQKGKQITIKAPVSGTITEINEALVADPFTINNSPYNEGWMYKIEPSNWARELSFLRMGSSYKEWIKNEVVRLKDFLACSFNIENLTEGKLIFQEGGELAARPLKDMSPEIWEDFQSHFIDSASNY